MHYNLHKVGLNRVGPYKDSPKRLKNKKTTMNSIKNENKCFQYALTIALNYQNIKKIYQKYQILSLSSISINGKI